MASKAAAASGRSGGSTTARSGSSTSRSGGSTRREGTPIPNSSGSQITYRPATSRGSTTSRSGSSTSRAGSTTSRSGAATARDASGSRTARVVPDAHDAALPATKVAGTVMTARGAQTEVVSSRNTRGVKITEDDLRILHAEAEEDEIEDAMLELGRMYEAGAPGLPQNYKEAFRMYQLAANKDNDIGLVALGRLYENGTGVKRSRREAAKLYKRAAEKGNRVAMCYYGEFLLKGKGVKKDSKEGAKWITASAEADFAPAQYRLGTLYQDGKGGLPKSMKDAMIWYGKSAEQGNRLGLARVSRLRGLGKT